MRMFIAFVFLVFPFFQHFQAAAASDPASLAKDGQLLLDLWQFEAAGELAAELEEDDSVMEVAYFLGRYHFEGGDYIKALEYLETIGDERPNYRVYDYGKVLRAAYEATRDFKTAESEHFLFRYAEGKDEILVDEVLNTLEHSRREVGKDLGYLPPDRIVVEMYPRLEMLSGSTGLSMKALRTTGTIAITKFNRIMISSPRVGIYGYPWRDTLCHEYTHLVISRVTANSVPIWLHEALAKMHEERWRNPPGGSLSRSSESLLARALREKHLVTIEEMSPSMALLPSQEHAALGYTEVLTMAQWLYRRSGTKGFRNLLLTLREEGDLDTAFFKVYGLDVSALQKQWERDMRKAKLRELDTDFNDYEILFGEADEEDAQRRIGRIAQKKGRDMLTLGKLLKDRKHPEAALVEFDKARKSLGDSHPLLHNYRAETLLELQRPDEAIESLSEALDFAPNHLPSHIRAARAFVDVGRCDKAMEHLNRAFDLNPFDPRIYKLRKYCFTKTGKAEQAEQAEKDLGSLQ